MALLRVAAVALLLVLGLVPVAAAADPGTPREQQWGLERVRAPVAWSDSRGADVVVAVVDTGVDLTHPDLAPRLLRDGNGRVVGRDEVDDDHDPQDGDGHGTHVAGVAAAAADAGLEGEGIAGVAPGARIMPVRVLDDDGRGSMSDLDAGIRWAVDNGADVINLSLESAVPLPGEVLATGPDDAVRYAWERGVPVVAAAGNTGTPFTDYRSSTPVLLVGATDRDDRRAAFSDAGRSDMVFAPGVDILSSTCDPCGDGPRHGYGSKSGTSFAAPHVAGAAALLLARGATHEQAVERLRETAVDLEGGGVGGSTGHGRIDAAAAVGIGAAEARATRDDEAEDEADTDVTEPDGARNGSGDDGGEPREQDEPTRSEDATGGRDPDGDGERAADPEPEPEPEPEPDEPEPDDPVETDEEPSVGEGDGTDADAVDGSTASREQADAVELPQGSGRLRHRIGLLEGLAAGLVATSAAAVVGVRRRYGIL